MSTRYYPLYQRGNPQLRIFLPNFWMKLVRSEEPLPPNVVLFRTSIEMTRFDVKNYLEKIYKVPVVEVKTAIKMGTIRRAYGKQYLVKEDDYKEALVTLPIDQKFEYPEFLQNKETVEAKKSYKKMIEYYKEKEGKNRHLKGIPMWFRT